MSLKYEVYKEHHYIAYYRHNRRHRVGGPSGIWVDGDMVWREYGDLHRLNGTASLGKRYYIRGVGYTKEEYESKIRSLS